MNINIYTHLLTFFLGLLIGHRLNLRRDRRKEFNEIADRIAPLLDVEERAPRVLTAIPHTDLAPLQRHLGWYKRWRYSRALERYEQAKVESQYQNASGEILYRDTKKSSKPLAH